MNNDCLLNVLCYLDVSDILNCSCVNKQFNYLTKNNLIWPSLFNKYFWNINCTTKFYNDFKKCYKLNKFLVHNAKYNINYVVNWNVLSLRNLKTSLEELWLLFELLPKMNFFSNKSYKTCRDKFLDNLLKFPYGLTMTNCRYRDLRMLQLDHNNLQFLPQTIGNLSVLRMLHLNDNELSILPEEIGQCGFLEVLTIRNNRLQCIPEAFGRLSELRVLDLSHNKLEIIPEAICKLTKLQKLYVNDNKIRKLPLLFGQLTRLHEIQLNNNQLIDIPEEIGNLKLLKILTLNHNLLNFLPDSVNQLTKLQILRLDNNPFLTLPPINNLQSLNTISLSTGHMNMIDRFIIKKNIVTIKL